MSELGAKDQEINVGDSGDYIPMTPLNVLEKVFPLSECLEHEKINADRTARYFAQLVASRNALEEVQPPLPPERAHTIGRTAAKLLRRTLH